MVQTVKWAESKWRYRNHHKFRVG